MSDYVNQVLQKVEADDTPHGEVLLNHDLPRRWAERDGTYDVVYAAMNPA